MGGIVPSVLTTGLSVGTGLDEEDVERWREVPGGLVLLVSLVEGHEQVLLHRQGGLGNDRDSLHHWEGNSSSSSP